MLTRLIALLILLAQSVLAQEGALIRVGETWRYFKGVQEPDGGSNRWQRAEFDDSAWPAGPSGFSTGFGFYDEATVLETGTNQSFYFRKLFVVTNLSTIQWPALRVDYNDGLAVFLNGHEIARLGLPGEPGTPIPYFVSATNQHLRTETEEIRLTDHLHLLKPGTNVLAAQLHKTGPFDYSAAFVPELLANFTRGPYIQNLSSNQVQIIWKTAIPTQARVDFGTDGIISDSLENTGLSDLHVMTLTNLLPDTIYEYRVSNRNGEAEVVSSVARFHTLKTSGGVSFLVLGDSGSGSVAQHQLADAMRNLGADLVLHAGDVVYPSFTYNHTDARCLSVYQEHMKGTPYFFAMGNHDLNAGEGPYFDAFYLPTNTVTGTELFYSFDHGDVHFVVLFVPFLSQYRMVPGDFQHRWLEADLASSAKPWKFLVFHHPMITSGKHGFDDINYNNIPDQREVMGAILPLASRYGVQAAFSGHDHGYERFNPIDGVHSIVTGGGGVGLYPMAHMDQASAQFWLKHHCVVVTVEGNEAQFRAVDAAGREFDSMTIYREKPSRTTYKAAWHAPVVEGDPANDGDGNVAGQRFDFVGDPIPGAPGLMSNLGRFYVNNDDTHLYIGIEQCMVYSDSEIYFFLEVPGVPGSTHLNSSEIGSDELQAFRSCENLSFTNFAPNVAGVFGDELADGHDRLFRRPALTQPSGQGLYFLDEKFTGVEGARLQQYNRSPQTGPVPGEQNANFVEVAIPLSSLGETRPGQTIRIGAVVAKGDAVAESGRLTRHFDTAFVGAQFHEEGSTRILEGLEVHLAIDPEGDPDQDGLTSAQESEIGTNPNLADTDGDDVPDGWEVAHGLDPLSAMNDDGTEGDPDGDGFVNRDEFLAGTDPRDRLSRFAVEIQRMPDNRVLLSWSTVAGRRYEVQTSSKLGGAFTTLGGHSANAADGGNRASFVIDANAGGNLEGPRYFRIRAFRELNEPGSMNP